MPSRRLRSMLMSGILDSSNPRPSPHHSYRKPHCYKYFTWREIVTSVTVYWMALGNQLAGNQPVNQPPLAQVGGWGGGGGTIVPPPAPTPVYCTTLRVQ
jgi:hypothetical protein